MSVLRNEGDAVEGKMLYIVYDDLVYNIKTSEHFGEMVVAGGTKIGAMAIVMEKLEWI